MSAIISPGELTIGMYITVFEWNKEEKSGLQESENMLAALLGKAKDKRFCGEVLKIKAVQLPYVAVEYYGQILSLDSRDCKFMELNEEYVKAKTLDSAKGYFKKLGLETF